MYTQWKSNQIFQFKFFFFFLENRITEKHDIIMYLRGFSSFFFWINPTSYIQKLIIINGMYARDDVDDVDGDDVDDE